MDFDFKYLIEMFPLLIPYVPMVLIMAVLSTFFAIVLGLLLGLITKSKIPVLYQITIVYISYFRGTPSLVQIFLFYFGLPQLFPQFAFINGFTAVIIALSLRNSAYLSEVFRSALSAVERGQMEAALSVGMTKWQGLRRIVFPQATRIAIPPTGNFFIMIIKETSLAFTIGLTDMFAQAKLAAAGTYNFFESYLAVAIIYWGLTALFAFIQSLYEKRLDKPYEQGAAV
ncbi:amino acid ABC transporter permease [Bacillus gobiensis]|uniref:amino acid ABC transporter permease n=1 Tax=Bacillus gobiensis TaxID=1441095 RepID=UPI003D1DBB74